MTAITFDDGSSRPKRCDATCHNAHHSACHCICAGVLHGTGQGTPQIARRLCALVDEIFGVRPQLVQLELPFTEVMP